jgi:hypothetical protein
LLAFEAEVLRLKAAIGKTIEIIPSHHPLRVCHANLRPALVLVPDISHLMLAIVSVILVCVLVAAAASAWTSALSSHYLAVALMALSVAHLASTVEFSQRLEVRRVALVQH